MKESKQKKTKSKRKSGDFRYKCYSCHKRVNVVYKITNKKYYQCFNCMENAHK